MKSVLTTILAILYLATSTGAIINVHYCMGEVVSKSIVHEDKCGQCGMEKKEGCCEDKVQVVKTQDSHSFHTPHITFTPFVAIIQKSYTEFIPVFAFATPSFTTHNNSPPGSAGTSLCIRNCVFRI